MKYGISSLLGSGLAGALLLGSGCLASFEDGSSEEGSETVEDEVRVPHIAAKLSYGDTTCILPAGETSVTCAEPVEASEIMQVSVDIESNGLTPSPAVINPGICASKFADPVADGSAYQLAWHASLFSNMACELTLETSTVEGPFTTVKMYFSVVNGQPPDEVYGAIVLEHTSGQCRLFTGEPSTDCEQPVRAGELTFVYVSIGWGKYEPGSFMVRDDCGGTFMISLDHGDDSQGLDWKAPSEATTCTLALETITASGESRVFEMKVPVQ